MSFPRDQIDWLGNNPAKVSYYARVLQILIGLLFLSVGLMMGKGRIRLLVRGESTQGKIIAYEQEHWASTSRDRLGTTAYMPIVEYRMGTRAVRFKDWLGKDVAGTINVDVPVLYDPGEPSVAMIDRKGWNWVPWSPIAAIGLLLLFSGVKKLVFAPSTESLH